MRHGKERVTRRRKAVEGLRREVISEARVGRLEKLGLLDDDEVVEGVCEWAVDMPSSLPFPGKVEGRLGMLQKPASMAHLCEDVGRGSGKHHPDAETVQITL